MSRYILSILIWLPTLGALFALLARNSKAVKWTALGTVLATFLASLAVLAMYDFHKTGPYGSAIQLVQRGDWIKAFNIEYFLGIDGLSFPLVLLTTFIFVLAVVASWKIEKMTRGYLTLMLLLETGILGTFLSLDFFLFYVFFEVSLLPMYFLIGLWGGPRREYAAIKFFLYTLLGSVGLLIVLIGTYLQTHTFDLIKLASPEMQAQLAVSSGTAKAFFLLLMLGFLVKVPSVPLHTWLPDAHVEAPTPVSMILAAILLKMGGYGIFRIAYPLYPQAGLHFWWLVGFIGVASIIYGALCAMSQSDFKKLVAYSSVSHMGFVVLGAAMMTDTAVNGALFMMIAHGITSAMMFFIVGVIYDRAHHRELSRLGGLAGTMPIYTGLSTVGIFANLGLPGLCGFIGEIMVLLGTFQAARSGSAVLAHCGSSHVVFTYAVIACFGVVLSAAYMLWTLQRVFFGAEKPEYKALPEVNSRELAVLVPLAVMAILLGILPGVLFFPFTGSTLSGLFQLVAVVNQ